MPEGFRKIKFNRFTGIVTMDAYGKSLHEDLRKIFNRRLTTLIKREERIR
jgi:hypothetical protein